MTTDDIKSALPEFAKGVTVNVRQNPRDYRVFEIMIFDPRPNTQPKTFAFVVDELDEHKKAKILQGCVKGLEKQLHHSGLLKVG